MILSKLLKTVYTQATVRQIEHEGFGNGDGTFTNVPYQILIHLYSRPREYRELKMLSYAGVTSPGAIRDPYSLQFGKMFDNYIVALNKILENMSGQLTISTRTTLSGAVIYYLD